MALVLHTRSFLLTHIQVSGLRQVTPAEIDVDLRLPMDTFTWQLRPWVLTRRLLTDPMIAAARVWVHWPNTLIVAIRERLPAALLAMPGGGRWEVDAHGRLLRYLPPTGLAGLGAGLAGPTAGLVGAAKGAGGQGAAIGARHGTKAGQRPVVAHERTTRKDRGIPADVPLIEGVALSDPVAGQPAQGQGLHQTLVAADGLGSIAAGLMTSIGWSGKQVILRTVSGLTVDFGDGSDARGKLAILLGILKVAQREKVRLAAVDLSAPVTPAVTLQAGSPPLVYGGIAAGSSVAGPTAS